MNKVLLYRVNCTDGILIYLDVCCLNRPFDEQTQERIRLEAEAVLFILTKFQVGDWRLLGSEAPRFPWNGAIYAAI
jgi:hypothetical protein